MSLDRKKVQVYENVSEEAVEVIYLVLVHTHTAMPSNVILY